MFSLETLERLNNPEFFAGDGAVYCRKHAGDDPDNDPDLAPVRGEWDYYPACECCGAVCEDVELTAEGRRRERPGAVAEALLSDYESGRKLSDADLEFARKHATPERLVEAYNERLEYAEDEPPVVAAARTASDAWETRQQNPQIFQAAVKAMAGAVERQFRVRFIQGTPEQGVR